MSKKLDAFGLPVKDPVMTKHNPVGQVVYENHVVIDKETFSPTVKITERDIDKEIQSYKDECGIAFVMRQIAAGRLSLNQVCDDGKSGADLTVIPGSVNDAHQIALAADAAGKAAAAKIGLKTYTEEELKNYIAQEVAKAQASKASNNGGVE